MAVIALLLVTLGALAPARADRVDVAALPDITDTNWAMDLYQGSALGSLRIVGMGGAQVAIAEGAAGMVANPAAPAVRPSTSNDKWDWDWFADWLNPDLASDFDNNGIDTTEKPEELPVTSFGLVGQYKRWAVGFALTLVKSPGVVSPTDQLVTTELTVGRLSVSRTYLDDRITAGIGVRVGGFSMSSKASSTDDPTPLFEVTGGGLEAGVIWRPRRRDIRVGGTLSLPIVGADLQPGACDNPMNCEGLILPNKVRVPWKLSFGFGYRRAQTRWNRQVRGDYRDERALMVAADVVITGPSKDGHGLEAFVKQKLQRSGAKTVASLRVGTEYEWLPGRLRVRSGSYFEPGRFRGVDGRLHLTGGVDVRVWAFRLWGKKYRVRISGTGDFARKYINAGLSLGFWH